MTKKLEEKIEKIESWMYKINKLLYGNMRRSDRINPGCCPGVIEELGLIAEFNLLKRLHLRLQDDVYKK